MENWAKFMNRKLTRIYIYPYVHLPFQHGILLLRIYLTHTHTFSNAQMHMHRLVTATLSVITKYQKLYLKAQTDIEK